MLYIYLTSIFEHLSSYKRMYAFFSQTVWQLTVQRMKFLS